MIVLRTIKSLEPECKNFVVAIGNFDGCHLGHKQVINKAVQIGKEKNLNAAIYTFYPHPSLMRGIKKEKTCLSPFRSKIRLFEDLGVNYIFFQHFNNSFADLSPNDFFDKIIIKYIKAKHVVVGHDFVFGKNRSGDIKLLQTLCEKAHIDYSVVPAYYNKEGILCSSTAIRNYLKNGEVEKAREMLGYNYSITGKVLKGKQIGRKIGAKTANIKLGKFFTPRYGVYAVKLLINNNYYFGVANIGIRPTVDGFDQLLEAHIFDFDYDIYNAFIKVELLEFIRPEEKFENLDALEKQIKKDTEIVKYKVNQY